MIHYACKPCDDVCVYVIPILRTILQVGDILRLSELPELWVVFDGFGRICSNQSSQKTLSSGWGNVPTYIHVSYIMLSISISVHTV